MILEFQKNDFLISTDFSKLQFDIIHTFLASSYWSPNIPMEIVKKAAQGSIVFGVYHGPNQIGYARVVSDKATFAYLADVFILETSRGQGLSKWLMECIMKVPELQGLRRWLLGTRDAHDLYAQFGFKPLDNPESIMEITVKNIYAKAKITN